MDVVIAAHVHESGRSIGQHHGPDTTLLQMHAERSLIAKTKAGRVTLCDASARPIHIITETTVVHEGVQRAGRGSNIVLGTGFLLASPGGMERCAVVHLLRHVSAGGRACAVSLIRWLRRDIT